MRRITVIAASLLAAGTAATAAVAQQGGATMSFFVTSAGSGRGADLGGLEGADRHCQELAAKGGAGSRTWRAYLSTQGAGAVNARDRIGRGPWQNAKGEVIAQSVDDLHGASNKISKQTALTETGEPVKGRGDTPNMHDILTGSQADGRAFPGADDMTCRNWTSARPAPRWSATTTAWGSATTSRRNPGTPRTRRAARTAAAARTRCAAPAAPACSTASRRTEGRRFARFACVIAGLAPAIPTRGLPNPWNRDGRGQARP